MKRGLRKIAWPAVAAAVVGFGAALSVVLAPARAGRQFPAPQGRGGPRLRAEVVAFQGAGGAPGRVLLLRNEGDAPGRVVLRQVLLNGERPARLAVLGDDGHWQRPWHSDQCTGKPIPGGGSLPLWLYADDPAAPHAPKWRDVRDPITFLMVTVEGIAEPLRVPVGQVAHSPSSGVGTP